MTGRVGQMSLGFDPPSARRTDRFPPEEFGWKKPREWRELLDAEKVRVAFPGSWIEMTVVPGSWRPNLPSIALRSIRCGEVTVERLESARVEEPSKTGWPSHPILGTRC